jgi:hypothetical protein
MAKKQRLVTDAASMLDGVKKKLDSPRARWVILVTSTILVLPSAGTRLVFDDHLQALMRTPEGPIPGIPYAPFDLFAFARPGGLNDVLIDRGLLLPWWTDPQLLVAFFRPLSSLTHVVDGWLWPGSVRMMHLHSVAWFALLLGVVATVYRRFLQPAWLATFAFLLYAIDDTHGATVSWIANRNALIASTFGLLAFLFHDRWRREGTARAASLAIGSFVVGLFAGEATIGACAYIGAYAIFVDRSGRRSRALSFLPYALIVVVWRAVYQWLGYGARGSDAYLDPGREPLAFLARLPERMALLLQGQLGAFSADLWFWSPSEVTSTVVAAAFVTTAVFAVVVFPLLKTDAMARFWMVGAVGAIVPSASSIPGDRLLVLPGIGVMALLALAFAAFVERRAPLAGKWRALWAVPLVLFLLRRTVSASLMLPLRAHSMEAVARLTDFAADVVQAAPDVQRRTVIVLNPPVNVLASYLGLTLATRGAPVPRHLRWLASAQSELTVTRLSERVLRVQPARGFFSHWTDRLYRSHRNPLLPGERVALAESTVTVGPAMPSGAPAYADFEFREPLESTEYLWLKWNGDTCAPSAPPRIGEKLVFPARDFAKMLFEYIVLSPFRQGA